MNAQGGAKLVRKVAPSPVAARAVRPEALKVALRLAGGDRRRLRLEEDGSVTVLNRPR